MSSDKRTFYPYCLWIKALNLGNLHSLLEDLARDQFRELRTSFFSDPLQDLHLVSKSKHVTRRSGGPVMDIDGIIIAVADKLTAFIKQAADQEDKTVTLASLEGYHLPSASLPTWVSRLSLLTSLTVRDGSVLNADVSLAIRANCPHFKEVVCHYCIGSDVDSQLAAFFSGLAPDSLESFTVMSSNSIREKTFKALKGHSESLRGLGLCLEQPAALSALNLLSDCKNLKWLTIEATGSARSLDWEREKKQEFLEVLSWLRGCLSLTSLDLVHVPNSSSILSQVLQVPEIKLKSLDVKLQDTDERFYSALGSQTSLESLVVRTNDELVDIAGPRHAQFVSSICSCTKLRKLDLMNEVLTLEDVYNIMESLRVLDDFSFDGELIDDDFLPPLANIAYLRTLNINALSNFSFAGLLNFVNDLASLDESSVSGDSHGSHPHDGVRIYIMRQVGEHKFSDQEERLLTVETDRRLGGRIEITYEGDPDELHESDFSD
jgi:hypothetical protein